MMGHHRKFTLEDRRIIARMVEAKAPITEIAEAVDKHLSVVDAASHLSVSRSQVHRLISAYKRDGASGLISKKRGKPSNRRYPDAVKAYAIETVREHYLDFGPTFAAEKLRENHGLSVSKETLRKWMIEAELWQHKTRRKDRIYQPRHRRDRRLSSPLV